MKHIGAISGGKDSTAMAVLLTEKYPDIEFIWICTPTGNEPPEWFSHMRTLRSIIGPIIPITYKGGLDGLIVRYNSLPSWRQRWCTRQLKIEPCAAYLMQNTPAILYVGLRADEEERQGGNYSNVPDMEMQFPLRDAGMGLHDVMQFLRDRNIAVPPRTDCMLCFFQKLIEWYELWRDHPDAYSDGEAYELMTGSTFRSPGRDTQPTSLIELRVKFEKGYIPQDTRDPLRDMRCLVCNK